MTRLINFLVFFVALLLAAPSLAQTTESSGEIDPSVADELASHPELGPRLISDLSDEAQKIIRAQLEKLHKPVLPSIPDEAKQVMFTGMMASSPMSMREMFNFMTSKMKVDEGLTFDDVIEAMDLKANEVNFKKVAHSPVWQDIGATTGLPTLRLEILQYCDAVVGQKMLRYSPEFIIFIPCRIGVIEEPNGDLWIMTMDWNVSWLAMAWHPDSRLDPELTADAVRIRDAMKQIMVAGATGDW